MKKDRKIPILDVMGPVMVGPSSSHTAGTARLGRVAREILDEDPVEVTVPTLRWSAARSGSTSMIRESPRQSGSRNRWG